MAATPRLCGKKCIVNGCKTIQVAGNGVRMRGFPWTKRPILWQWIVALERGGTPRKKVTKSSRICLSHFTEPDAAVPSIFPLLEGILLHVCKATPSNGGFFTRGINYQSIYYEIAPASPFYTVLAPDFLSVVIMQSHMAGALNPPMRKTVSSHFVTRSFRHDYF